MLTVAADFAIQFAKALGAKVVVFSHSTSKKDDCLKILGADEFVATADKDFEKPYFDKIDFMLSTADAAAIPISELLSTLKLDCKFVSVGLPDGDWEGLKPQIMQSNASCIGCSHIGSKVEV